MKYKRCLPNEDTRDCNKLNLELSYVYNILESSGGYLLKKAILSTLESKKLGNQYFEDVLEATLATAIQKTEVLKKCNNPQKWLYRVAYNHILHIERNERRLVRFLDLEENVCLSTHNISASAQTLAEVLPNQFRQDEVLILSLRYEYELSILDIAAFLKLSQDTVKQRLCRLRNRIRAGYHVNGN